MGRSKVAGRISVLAFVATGLLWGLAGCTPPFGLRETELVAILEAIPTAGVIQEDGKFYVDFYITAKAKAPHHSFYGYHKIVGYCLWPDLCPEELENCEGYGTTEYCSGPINVVAVERHKITHAYVLPSGVFERTYRAVLLVVDNRGNGARDEVIIRVRRP